MDITLQAQILNLRTAIDALVPAGQQNRQAPTIEQRWAPGEHMTARVEAQLPGGRFHVQVDDLLLEMNLPEGFQPGDKIELEFVSAQPRPSFLLKSSPDPVVRQDVQLSRGARDLGEILKAVAPPRAGETVPLKASTPILPAPSLDTARLAQALSTALHGSGLFYESHQSEWALGQRPLQDLLHEPQGRLSPIAQELSKTAGTTADVRTNASALKGAADVAAGIVAQTSSDDVKTAAQAVHPDTLPQVRSQLNTLETQQLVWQGQLWPNQNLEWRIEERPEQDAESGEPQPWFTQLRLHLPRLGSLTADLAIAGNSVRVRLAAAPDAEASMTAERAPLASALGAAGLDLVSFKVIVHGD
ncbi:MAG: flagellar hook-length control protein FliK [Betaproteobacteria bacterium]